MTLTIGDRVSDVTLLRPDGSAVTPAAFGGGQLLMIFLRHLA